MPRITGTTNAQSAFLRTFITNPTGPSAADFPAPAIFRRWLRRPAFRQAINSLHETMEDQTDLYLAQAARSAASCLADSLTVEEGSDDPIPIQVFHPLLAIIKSARQIRRPRAAPTPKPAHAGTERSAVPDPRSAVLDSSDNSTPSRLPQPEAAVDCGLEFGEDEAVGEHADHHHDDHHREHLGHIGEVAAGGE